MGVLAGLVVEGGQGLLRVAPLRQVAVLDYFLVVLELTAVRDQLLGGLAGLVAVAVVVVVVGTPVGLEAPAAL
jgi:hypothetical protein